MELGIPARKIDRIGVSVGRLISKRREEAQFGTLPAPTTGKMRIKEGKGFIAGDRHALAERRQQLRRRRGRDRLGECKKRFHIYMRRDTCRATIEEVREIVMLTRLHQPQMPA